jgi:hypothetical protein
MSDTKQRCLKITVGKKPVKVGPENGVGFGPIVSMDGRILCHTVIWPGHDESEANASLYADAHNTANEVDMLPSELLAKLREVSQTIERLKKQVELCDYRDGLDHDLRMNAAYLDLITLNLPKP